MATQRTMDFYTGWFLHPLVFGDYPAIVKKNAGTKLPVFTSKELNLVKGAFDFLGLKTAYGNPPTYIHENGMGTVRDAALDDKSRVEYVQSYLGTLLDALRDGANTKGYFLWSFLDGFELLGGFKVAYGLYYVDLDDKELKRYPKLSAHWYSNFLKGRFEILNSANSTFIASQ